MARPMFIGDDAVWRASTGAALGVHRGMGFAALESWYRYWYNLFFELGSLCRRGGRDVQTCRKLHGRRSRRRGLGVSLSVSAMAAGVSPPDFAPNPSVGWFAYAREFIPPASGAGPVRQDPADPPGSNGDVRG